MTVPAELDGHPVREIGHSAFASCYSLTSVTLPEGLTTISNHAFDSCHALTTIALPEGLTSIGDSAFYV